MERGWTEIDWDAPRPSYDEVQASQRRIRFVPAPLRSKAADRLIAAFRSILTKGDAQIAAFTIEDADEVARWFLSRHRFDEYALLPCLLGSDGLAEAMPDVVHGAVPWEVEFRVLSSVRLDGDIAATLEWGGAYEDFDGRLAEAKRLGVGFSDEIIGDRYDDFSILTCGGWSDWFRGAGGGWDSTWVIIDMRNLRITMLCTTDTD